MQERLRKIIAKEKQEWNKRCNEACEKQVLKQVLAAYEDAAMIAEVNDGRTPGSKAEGEALSIASAIRRRAQEIIHTK